MEIKPSENPILFVKFILEIFDEYMDVGGATYEDFFNWAFGAQWRTIQGSDTPAIWNDRHPDLFQIGDDDPIYLGLYQMVYEFVLTRI